METARTIASMRLLGGAPALDFVNTVDARRDRWGPDLLVTFDDLVAWARRVNLVDVATAEALAVLASHRPAAAETALAQAKSLREAAYRILLCETSGREPDDGDLALLRGLAKSASGQRELRRARGRFWWDWDGHRDADTIIHRLAFEIATFLVDTDRRPVRECTGPNCGWLFVDQSKGGRRRWCSDETCGAHSRMLKYRSRR